MRITRYKVFLNSSSGNPELVKEASINYTADNGTNVMSQPGDVVRMINSLFHLNQLAEEYVYIVAFNTKLRVLGVFEVAHGGAASCVITPREIYQRALLIGATGIIMLHNHPSGETTPSKDDLLFTRKLSDAGELIGINLLDHIIVAGQQYLSMKLHNIY